MTFFAVAFERTVEGAVEVLIAGFFTASALAIGIGVAGSFSHLATFLFFNSLGFPLGIVVAKERSLKVKFLRKPRHRNVPRDHGVLRYSRGEAPPAVGVLAIKKQVLPADLYIRMSEDLIQIIDDFCFLFFGPIGSAAVSDKGDTNGFGKAPRESSTLYVVGPDVGF